ncbi:hypothetical protein EB118_15225 [bacterium]|nr:hypothetical protein [bacterium]
MHADQFETGLYIVRYEIDAGISPVEAFVYAGNIALHDAVDTFFVFDLANAAFRDGLLDATRNRMYGPTEIVNSVYRLVQSDIIVPDSNNPATYFHPRYLQDIARS